MQSVDLSPFFQTKSQANDFLARIATLSEQTYTNNFNLERALLAQFGIEKKDRFLALLRDNQINTASATELKAFFTNLQAQIASMKQLTITLAFEPTEQTLKSLADWCILNLKKQILFDVKVNPAILAGALFAYNGKQMNFSLKPQFDHIVQTIMNPPAQQSKSVTQPTPVTHG
jgi:F0F1-type ATP synthase delta subunit